MAPRIIPKTLRDGWRTQFNNMVLRCRRDWRHGRQFGGLQVVEGCRSLHDFRIDMGIDPVASPLRDALRRSDLYLNGVCIFLRPHLRVRHRQRLADGLLAGSGVHVFFTERILLSAVRGVLAVVLIVVLQIIVPHNTGLLDSATLFANFVGMVIVIVAAPVITTFALREVARAEADLAHEHRPGQEPAVGDSR